MNNSESEKNNAIFGGLIGLAAVFFTIKEMLIPDNIFYLIFLIVVFLIVSLIRVFGTILGIDAVNKFSIELFKFFVVPTTVFVLTRIFITQIIGIDSPINMIPSMFSAFVLGAIIGYEITIRYKFELRFPLKIRKRK